MRSKVGEVMREERLRKGVTQQELGLACGIDRSCISEYETGKASVPQDVLARAIRYLQSPRLQTQACFECQVNLLTMPWLDRVDMHPMTVRDKVMQELDEAKEALSAVDLINKLDAERLTKADWQALEHAAEQLADLFAALHTLFGVWQERYGLNPDDTARKAYRKLCDKGYASPQTLNQQHWRAIA